MLCCWTYLYASTTRFCNVTACTSLGSVSLAALPCLHLTRRWMVMAASCCVRREYWPVLGLRYVTVPAQHGYDTACRGGCDQVLHWEGGTTTTAREHRTVWQRELLPLVFHRNVGVLQAWRLVPHAEPIHRVVVCHPGVESMVVM